ncbi:hypothetical protein [Streptomyces rubiginosohelvolus]
MPQRLWRENREQQKMMHAYGITVLHITSRRTYGVPHVHIVELCRLGR